MGNVLDVNGVSYTVKSPLGEGGAAKVFRVRSSADGKDYALKKIAKSGSERRDKRFREEIKFGKVASNDHVVKIHDESEDADYFYYTMDLYAKSLRDIIREESDHQVLLDYLSQLCEGIAYVHGEGAVHRDIKPENILVDSGNRRLVLADFGIAHFKDSSLTRKGDLLANRNYLAPEQMVKNNAKDVGKPADIFALGLIITEVFTKQNSRGARHRRVGDVYPFLSDVDLLVESTMLQDETQRIKIQAVSDALHLTRKRVDSSIEGIMEELRWHDESTTEHTEWYDASTIEHTQEKDLVFRQAGTDVLSAKYIFERTTDEELSRYNLNYHCEISYRVSDELYNACVQSQIYSICKAKFEYEASGTWKESDLDLVVSPSKASLLSQLGEIQHRYPLARNSMWEALPRMAAHYFRFCKDYHCKEIIRSICRLPLVSPPHPGIGLGQQNLVNAPIIWIVSSVRSYLKSDFFEMSPQDLQQVELERHVSIDWEETSLDNTGRKAVGADLFAEPLDAQPVARALKELEENWNVSIWERGDGSYSIHFQSREEYMRFSKQARARAASDYVFEGDVIDLLRVNDEDDDLVELVWTSTFDIPSTLAKVLNPLEI
ncbi:serine/threonine-protein kinase [Arthrobacter agilis]|uniref:serine/threonine-protein kinase n=1 Tax=Arthrobacter agilis TaxID=37921 RepID=UPI0027D7E218|nr:serine/threonine-protein kinase [Arthrobacter agilis]